MNEWLLILVNSFWFILPAYFANGAPVLSSLKFVKKYNFRLDLGIKFKGKPLLGSHKTGLGFLFGILAALVIGLIQILIQNMFTLDIFEMTLKLAIVLGLGAMSGDLTASFIKRRLGLKSGAKAPALLDQLNLLLGAFIFSLLVIPFQWKFFIVLLIITPWLHRGANLVAYKLKLKKQAW